MLNRTRVSSIMDAGRLSELVSRPGIDPRVWVSLAVVDSFLLDPTFGPVAAVTLLPSLIQETVRVPSLYAGAGFGIYAKLQKDDNVVVMFPGGDPDHGGVVVSRLWDMSSPPPVSASLPARVDDLLVVAEAGTSVRIEVSGAGDVTLDPKGTGKVEVGGSATNVPPDLMEPMILGQTLTQHLTILYSLLATHFHPAPGTSPSATLTAALSPGTGTLTVQLPLLLATKATVK